MAKPSYLECMECNHHQPYQPLQPAQCEQCGSGWVEAHYDYAAFKRSVLRGLPDRKFNLWRYHEVLPVSCAANEDFANVGGTPLYLSRHYGQALGHPRLYIKDERYGPTNSFKDRQAAISVTALIEAGVQETVIASTGNAAVAYAAACARAGIKLWVFMTSTVPAEKLREVALFGAEVIKVSGTYDQAKQIAADFARRRGLPIDRGTRSIPAREAMKTIAYEIAEQLDWQVPDWYIQSISGGLGPLGVQHGFQELHAMGLIDRIPAMALIQTEGCAPMVRAFKAGKNIAERVIPETLIPVLSTGDPGQAYTYLWQITRQFGGTMESVTDSEAFATMRKLAKTEGLAVEPATAVAFAGLEKLIAQGQIRPDETVVVNCTGHTFPVEKHVLDDPWGVDVHLGSGQAASLHEGLDAALERLDERTTTVLVMDDNPDDALLIRRFLETRKPYRVFHARLGWDGLAQARQRLPDLIILDLMMPDLDGFGVLEELKLDPRTRRIPVIVVSAKDITESERKRLSGQIEAIYQKGTMPPRAFVDHVVDVLEHRQTPDKNPGA